MLSYTIVCRRNILFEFLLYTNTMCTKHFTCSCHMTQCNIKIQIHILSVRSYLLCIKLKSVILNHQNVLIIIHNIFHLNCWFQGTIISIILYSYKYFIKVIVKIKIWKCVIISHSAIFFDFSVFQWELVAGRNNLIYFVNKNAIRMTLNHANFNHSETAKRSPYVI